MPTNDPYRLGKKYIVTDRWLPTSPPWVPPPVSYQVPLPWPSDDDTETETSSSEEELVEEIIYLKHIKRRPRSRSPPPSPHQHRQPTRRRLF